MVAVVQVEVWLGILVLCDHSTKLSYQLTSLFEHSQALRRNHMAERLSVQCLIP